MDDISEEYYTELGRFVHLFAMVEGALFFSLVALSGIDLDVFAATMSGTRARQAMDFIRRIHEAKRTALPERLSDVFGQLAAINTARDLILHSGARKENGELLATNRGRAHTKKSVRVVPVSPEHLRRMSEDLRTIIAAIEVFTLPHAAKRFAIRGDTSLVRENSLAQRAWLYKPPAQGSTRPPSGASPQEPSRQRKPSRE